MDVQCNSTGDDNTEATSALLFLLFASRFCLHRFPTRCTENEFGPVCGVLFEPGGEGYTALCCRQYFMLDFFARKQ